MAHALIIDDDAEVRTNLRAVLEELDYRVTEAEDGFIGVERYMHDPAELVLCDLHMPLQDGLSTIRDLRRLDPNATIIALKERDREISSNLPGKVRHAGVVNVIAKPCNLDVLATAIAQLVPVEVGPPAPTEQIL